MKVQETLNLTLNCKTQDLKFNLGSGDKTVKLKIWNPNFKTECSTGNLGSGVCRKFEAKIYWAGDCRQCRSKAWLKLCMNFFYSIWSNILDPILKMVFTLWSNISDSKRAPQWQSWLVRTEYLKLNLVSKAVFGAAEKLDLDDFFYWIDFLWIELFDFFHLLPFN